MHTYMHTYVRTYIHTYIHTYIDMDIDVDRDIDIHARVSVLRGGFEGDIVTFAKHEGIRACRHG